MKIIIHEQGKPPKILEDVKAYRLIAAKSETTVIDGGFETGFDLAKALTIAQAVEREYRRFAPMIAMRQSMQPTADADAGAGEPLPD